MSISRTPLGLEAEHLFYQETVVYVEGYTDIPFYHALLQDYKCRIQSKNGRAECIKLAAALAQENFPYVVILDGNYEILESTRSKHRRAIYLHRHSFENYLFEKVPVEEFCRERTPLEDSLEELPSSKFSTVIEDVEIKFKGLIVLDVAHQHSNTGYNVLPNKPDQFLKRGKSVKFREDKIQQRCVEATQCIDSQSLDNAKTLVERFIMRGRRFIDLLPGHFAFGIMRRLIIHTVGRGISNEDVRVPLSKEVWRLANTPDHESLKRRLRRAVREAQKMPRTGKGI